MDDTDYQDLSRKELIEELIKTKKELERLKPKGIDDRKTEDCLGSSALCNDEIARYSRQLILPELGPSGQKKLKESAVLIVGCGGLGCPAAVYLAAAGIGKMGLVDYDVVEINNLHRQILHSEAKVGMPKSISVIQYIKSLNHFVQCVSYNISLDSSSIMKIIKDFDIVLDCTDNAATRYLLNDACILQNRVLVSGSALRFEGQLTVYNYNDGPCYRCLFPSPPPPETIRNCSDGGVLGVVPGVIGSLQALEAVKVICSIGSVMASRMLLFDALAGSFRVVKLRGRRAECAVCGTSPTITKLVDYEQFCGARASDKDRCLKLLSPSERITVYEYRNIVDSGQAHLLIDTRSKVELEICALPGAVNIPLKKVSSSETVQFVSNAIRSNPAMVVICVCRRGNESQKAVLELKSLFPHMTQNIKDIVGGLTAWAKYVDPTMPVY